MSKRPTQQDLLEGIKENIRSTEHQILHLKRDLDVLPEDGVTVERRTLLHQISILEDNLQLLRMRWMHAVNPQPYFEHPLFERDGGQDSELP